MRIVRIDQQGNRAALGTSSCSSSSRFGTELTLKTADARDVAARPVEAGNETKFDRVAADVKTIGIVAVAALAASAAGGADRDDHGHLAANQIGRQRRQPIVLTFRPAVFDRYIAALDIAGFIQALRYASSWLRFGWSRAAEKPDHRHRRLLRACRERPAPPRRRAVMNSRRFIRSPRRRATKSMLAIQCQLSWRS